MADSTSAGGTYDAAKSLSRHRSVWEMRADGWIGLVDDLGRLAILPRDHAEWTARMKRVRQTTAALQPVESYWAFPGGRVFGELCNWIERSELARAHQAARRIHRMLAAQTYRHESRGAGRRQRAAVADRDRQRTPGPVVAAVLRGPDRRRDVGQRRRARCAGRVQRKRSPDDDFIFDVVVVPSFEDALIATLVNFNLQAVVIRHGFPFRSINHNDMLRRFLDGLDGASRHARVRARPSAGAADRAAAARARSLPGDRRHTSRTSPAHSAKLPAHLLSARKTTSSLHLDHAEGVGERHRDAVLQCAARIRQQPDRRVPCAAAGARQVDHELALDRRPGAVLRHEPLHGRDFRNLRRARFAARSRSAR